MIIGLISDILTFSSKVIDAIEKHGDKADNMRLKDIAGWRRLKKRVRRTEGVRYFNKEWAAAVARLRKR